jgi:hypothetical protein
VHEGGRRHGFEPGGATAAAAGGGAVHGIDDRDHQLEGGDGADEESDELEEDDEEEEERFDDGEEGEAGAAAGAGLESAAMVRTSMPGCTRATPSTLPRFCATWQRALTRRGTSS